MSPIKYATNKFEWDWNLLDKILSNDEETWNRYGNQLNDANIGDVYYLQGNETLHDVTPVIGDKERIVFVTAYSEDVNFKHFGDVRENDYWNGYDIEEAMGIKQGGSDHDEL